MAICVSAVEMKYQTQLTRDICNKSAKAVTNLWQEIERKKRPANLM